MSTHTTLPPETVELNLPVNEHAPRRGREFADEIATWASLGRERANDLRLLVSELVTNSVRHAGTGTVRLRASLDEQRLKIEVHDDGRGVVPVHREPPAVASSGRGLRLVEWLADRWGTNADGDSYVWFELTRT